MSKPLTARTLSTSDELNSLSRAERKRRDTRDRIVREAESLMRSQPMDVITIQDITDA
ncbi:MAG: hypothetical protein HOJ11_06800, partial [Gammaproteobacteria bacterium]|nr:hypothetical protein [Gammaproteobacteria bacterium]